MKRHRLVAVVVVALAGCMTRPTYTYYTLPRPPSPATPAARCFEARRLQLVVARSDVEFQNTEVTDFGAYSEARRWTGSDQGLGVAFYRNGELRPASEVVRELGDPVLIAAQAARLRPLERRWHTKIGLSALGYVLAFGGLAMMLSSIAFVGDDTLGRPIGLIVGGGATVLAGALTIYFGGRAVNTVGGKVDVARRLVTDGRVWSRVAAAADAYNGRVASECGVPPAMPPMPPLPSPPNPDPYPPSAAAPLPAASHDHAMQ